MNICIVTGARPNFIKVAPIIRAIAKHNQAENSPKVDYELVYTGAETDDTLEASLFDDLQIHRPHTYLNVVGENLNVLVGEVMAKFELHLQSHPTDAVVVVDDLSSTMGVAIVAKKQGLLLAHIAAGTRSFDINMPKEINRLVIDGLSDILFTAGISNNSIANREGAELSKVYMVGNILIDNLRLLHKHNEMPETVTQLGIKDGEYLVFTLNRKALIADKANLREMLRAMAEATQGHIPIIAPLRGKAAETVQTLVQEIAGADIRLVSPMGYLDFMYLTAHAKGIVTDSGNVAEEATFNGVPCITLNSYTEHYETVKVGTNVLVGEDATLLQSNMKALLDGSFKTGGIPERWDGRSAERILRILIESTAAGNNNREKI